MPIIKQNSSSGRRRCGWNEESGRKTQQILWERDFHFIITKFHSDVVHRSIVHRAMAPVWLTFLFVSVCVGDVFMTSALNILVCNARSRLIESNICSMIEWYCVCVRYWCITLRQKTRISFLWLNSSNVYSSVQVHILRRRTSRATDGIGWLDWVDVCCAWTEHKLYAYLMMTRSPSRFIRCESFANKSLPFDWRFQLIIIIIFSTSNPSSIDCAAVCFPNRWTHFICLFSPLRRRRMIISVVAHLLVRVCSYWSGAHQQSRNLWQICLRAWQNFVYFIFVGYGHQIFRTLLYYTYVRTIKKRMYIENVDVHFNSIQCEH